MGRFVAGIAAGISTVVGTLYLSEISPIRLRGFSGTFYQLAGTMGVVTSEILGLDKVLGTQELWPYALGFTIVPAINQLLTMPWCPETPRYLMIYKCDDVKAKEALSWLRGKSDVHDELLEMQEEREKHGHENNKFKFIDLFLKKELRWPVIISLMMQLSQQFSGINAVVYYSTSIFEKAGLNEQNAQYATIGSASVNMLMTFISAVLIDRLGRRTLYLASLFGVFLSSLTLSVAEIFQSEDKWLTYLCIVSICCYLLSFGTGTGSIPWFFVAELFSQNSRPAAVSLATLVNWLSNFVVGLVFPELQKSIGPYSFLPFVGFLLVFLIFAFFKVPETKGKTIEEITAMFKKGISSEEEK